MAWPAVAAFVISLIGSAVSAAGGSAAHKKSTSSGKAIGLLEQRTTQEKVKLLEEEERQLAGETRARAASSGVKTDVGSPLTILAEQARTFERERRFTKEVGAEKSQLAIRRGEMIGSQARSAGFSQGLGSAATALSLIGRSG